MAETRHITRSIEAALVDTPVVCVLGPRQCGKSTLVEHLAPERSYFDLDSEQFFQTAQDDPAGFIDALPEYAAIDEVQRVPALFRNIKVSVDRNRRPGRFILTGSANLLLLPQTSESLAGRMEIIQLHPLTEDEKAGSKGRFLEDLIKGGLQPQIQPAGETSGTELENRLLFGGYPEAMNRSPGRARQWFLQYLRTLIERDVQDIARIRDSSQLQRLLVLLSLFSWTDNVHLLASSRNTLIRP